MSVVAVDFYSYDESIPEALDRLDVKKILAMQAAILIKPNLVNASPHPVTTHVDSCETIVQYIQAYSDAEIVIGEGCGDSVLETDEVFRRRGYTKLAQKYGIELIDLNKAPLKHLKNQDCPVFPEMYLPEIAFTHFIISVPVLKAHSLAEITGTLKNLMGFAPPKYYSGRFGTWKKAVFHREMQQSIIDLNHYRHPDLTVIDASIGLADFHLGGPHCSPPIKKILAGFNPVEIDREAAGLLDMDWRRIPHLTEEY